MIRKSRWITQYIMSLALVASVFAGEIEEQILKLGAPSYDERESATQSLWAKGTAVLPALQQALKHKDLEVRTRARFILDRVELGIRPDSTDEQIANTYQFRFGSSHEKLQAVRALINKGPSELPKILELIESVTVPSEKTSLLSTFNREVYARISRYALANDVKNAKTMLDTCLHNGLTQVAVHGAAYYLVNGALDNKIKEFEGIDSAAAKRSLALLYRAAGNLSGARDAANASGDLYLLKNILIEMNDWSALTELPTTDFEKQKTITDDAMQDIVFLWLAGKTDDLNKASDWLEAEIRKLPDMNNQIWQAVEVFFITSQTQRGIRLLEAKRDYLHAAELRFSMLDVDEAWELVKKGIEAKPHFLFALKLVGARLYGVAGEREKATALFEELATGLRSPFSLMYQVVENELFAGMRQLALTHASIALAGLKSNHQRRNIFIKLYSTREREAEEWWTLLRKISPKENPARTMQRVDRIMLPHLTPNGEAIDFAAITKSFEALKHKGNTQQAHQYFVLGRAELQFGLLEQGKQHFAAALKLHSNQPDALRLLTTNAIKKQHWKEAVASLARMQSSSLPHLRYLLGYALSKDGNTKDGEAHMTAASSAMLADDSQRYQLITELRRLGLDDEADRQCSILLRTAPFMSHGIGAVLSSQADRAVIEGDIQKAVKFWERALVRPARRDGYFTNVRSYLSVPHHVHTYAAKQLIENGKIEEGIALADSAAAAHPGGIDMALELTPVLERANRKDVADRIFNEMYERLRNALKKYPNSAYFLNQTAWLAARTGRKLDEALLDASRAVELQPHYAAYIDTLAEVQFVKGMKAEALRNIHKAIVIEPDSSYYRRQLTRFQQ